MVYLGRGPEVFKHKLNYGNTWPNPYQDTVSRRRKCVGKTSHCLLLSAVKHLMLLLDTIEMKFTINIILFLFVGVMLF